MAPTARGNAVSDYEAQRLAKIAKNKALFQELQLNAASAGLAPSSGNKRARPSDASRKSKPEKKIKVEELGPRRTSSRIRGIVADSEVAAQKAEEEHVAWREAERAKRQRNADDIQLSDAVVAGANWNQSGNWLRNVGPAEPYERTFTDADIKSPSSKEIKELRTTLSALSLWGDIEPSRIKITPERIYSMALHPTEDKALVFAGDKMGHLGLFDGSQAVVKEEDDDNDELGDSSFPAITTFKTHTRTISAIHVSPSQPNALFTASYDSSIRRLDLEKSVATEVYAPVSLDIDDPLSGLSIPVTDPHMLYFTTLNGQFGMHDMRTPGASSATQLLQLSEKKIGGFSVHPQLPHLLATASLDRTLKLWDLRKLSGKGSGRLPVLIAEHESKLSVSHAAFNGAGQIATTSYDDTIKVHSLNGIDGMENCSTWSAGTVLDDFKPSVVIPHNNQTGRWVTILRPQWQQYPTSLGGGTQRFVIGNMNRFVDVYAGTGEQIAQLGGDGITAVPAVAVYHPSKDWIAAGTASGKLCLWM